jgi:hypothetical protein
MQPGWIAEVAARARPAAAGRPLAEMAPWAFRAVAWLLGAAVIFVAWRRLAGALAEPPDPPLLLAIGVVGAALAALFRFYSRLHSSFFTLHPSSLLPTAALATLAAALTFAATPLPVRLAFWGLLIVEEAWTFRPRRATASATKAALVAKPAVIAAGDLPGSVVVARSDELPMASAPASEVVQQLTRSQAADGSELLTGYLRLAFAPLQRTASTHVAFCPPFMSTPRLEIQQREGPPARVKTAQLLPYGARLDLKLAAAAEKPLAVVLQFTARSAPRDGN